VTDNKVVCRNKILFAIQSEEEYNMVISHDIGKRFSSTHILQTVSSFRVDTMRFSAQYNRNWWADEPKFPILSAYFAVWRTIARCHKPTAT